MMTGARGRLPTTLCRSSAWLAREPPDFMPSGRPLPP